MAAQCTCILLCLLAVVVSVAQAQELEARAYANAPFDVNFIGMFVGVSTGNFLVDRSLPIENMDAKVYLVGPRYTRTLNVAGKLAKLKLLVPFSYGDWEAIVDGQHREREIRGAADARFTFEVNVSGSPALDLREFTSYRQKTSVGVSLQVVAPTGQYDPSRPVNLGSNRWAFRPQVGASRALGKWIVEAAGTVWLYTENDGFFGGSTLEQDPIYAIQAHGVYRFRPGFWLGVGVGYPKGGATALNGVERDDEQTNTRAGIRLVYPLGKRHGLAFDFTSGVTTTIGADFDSFAVAYQYAWGGGQ
jgi:hypothetical protein